MQEFEGKERVIFYLSRRLLDLETRYSPTKKLCLCLYFSCTKLRHYLLSAECMVVSKANVIKHMLSMPILNGRVGKWILALSEFDLKYESAKAVKEQIMADFVTQHHKPSIDYVERCLGCYSLMDHHASKVVALALLLFCLREQVLSLLFQLNQLLATTKWYMKLFLRGFNFFMK